MRTILHVDMDAFFAAVEQLHRPELRGRPVIVGGDPNGRSVVSSASYEARAFGVHSAMPMAWARKLCPRGVFLPCDGARYGEASRMVFRILEQFTPDVEAASVDEAYLDVTGCERLFGPPLAIAKAVRARIAERLGLSASVGVASGRCVIRARTALARIDEALLERVFGVYGPLLRRRALGQDTAGLHADEPAKSMGKETTFDQDLVDRAAVEAALATLAEKVCRRLRQEGVGARTLTVKLRYSDFHTCSRARTLPHPTHYDSVAIPAAWELFRQLDTRRLGVRLVGVTASRLQPMVHQPSLFDAPAERRRRRLYAGVDTVRDRYGFAAIAAAARMRVSG